MPEVLNPPSFIVKGQLRLADSKPVAGVIVEAIGVRSQHFNSYDRQRNWLSTVILEQITRAVASETNEQS